jgi:alkanesulfonate monooxygenase SsuD/methylene tetrahydromethanopterin reductase-like flavin-dependent oxidoreductase (luciferase family)
MNVQFGIFIPQVGIEFDDLLARAQRVEELGIDSLWLYDHLYSPGLPATPSMEGWTAATALLARTSALRVGHLVLNNNFRHPALLARMATTLDRISNGRLDLGIGSGSYAPEHEEGGFPWGPMAERTERLREALEIITAMFSGAPTTFSGAHYRVAGLTNVPPPVQQPRPPIHIGGAGPRTLPLIARYADVWNVPTYAVGSWDERNANLARECEAIGRDPATIRRSLEAVLVLGEDEAALAEATQKAERRYAGAGWGLKEGGFIGTPDRLVERIGDFVEKGVSLFVFFPSDRGAGDMLSLLAEEVIPRVRRPAGSG